MINSRFEHELLAEVHRLDAAQQRRVLEFARSLVDSPRIKGEPGSSLLQSVGLFGAADLASIEHAIEEDCERIDWGGWE